MFPQESGSGIMQNVVTWLVQDDAHQAFLLRFENEELIQKTPLTMNTAVKYDKGVIGDTLIVDDRAFRIPTGRAKGVKQVLAEARIADPKWKKYTCPTSFLVQTPTTAEARFLSFWLQPQEEVHLWIRSSTSKKIPSSVIDPCRGRYRVLLTSHRMALVAISPFGDVDVQEVTPRTIARDEGHWRIGGREIRFSKQAEERLRIAQSLPGLGGMDRELAIVSIHHRYGMRRKKYRDYARQCLEKGISQGDPWFVITGFFLQSSLKIKSTIDAQRVDAALAELMRRHPDGEPLANWWEGFELDVEAGLLLLDRFSPRQKDRAWSLPFHRKLRDARHAQDVNNVFHGSIETAFGQHLIEAGDKTEAASVLQAFGDTLPPPSLSDLLPISDPTFSSVGDVNSQRLLCMEKMAEATALSTGKNSEILHQLTLLQPLTPSYLERAARSCEVSISYRCQQARALFEKGALKRSEAAESEEEKRRMFAGQMEPLQAYDLENLRHPATQDDSPLTILQTALAQTSRPETYSLKAYCSQIHHSSHPGLMEEIKKYTHFLGLPNIESYVSQGERDIGLRAYPGEKPLLLIGGRHLDREDSFFLDEDEMSFALASELAHLAFGHERATPEQVWAGLWGKGQAGLELVFTVLPAFKGWKMVDKVAKWWSLTKKAAKKIDKAKKKEIKPKGLALRTDDLIAAHQLMQLSADRVGLLTLGQIKPAIRSMFLMFKDHLPHLQFLEDQGELHNWVRDGGPDGQALTHFSIRIASLLSFYLSDEYQKASDRLLGENQH